MGRECETCGLTEVRAIMSCPVYIEAEEGLNRSDGEYGGYDDEPILPCLDRLEKGAGYTERIVDGMRGKAVVVPGRVTSTNSYRVS